MSSQLDIWHSALFLYMMRQKFFVFHLSIDGLTCLLTSYERVKDRLRCVFPISIYDSFKLCESLITTYVMPIQKIKKNYILSFFQFNLVGCKVNNVYKKSSTFHLYCDKMSVQLSPDTQAWVQPWPSAM